MTAGKWQPGVRLAQLSRRNVLVVVVGECHRGAFVEAFLGLLCAATIVGTCGTEDVHYVSERVCQCSVVFGINFMLQQVSIPVWQKSWTQTAILSCNLQAGDKLAMASVYVEDVPALLGPMEACCDNQCLNCLLKTR